MAFILNPVRKFTAKYIDEKTKESFEADFDFILTEDCFTEEMQKKIKEIGNISKSDSEEEKEIKQYKAQSIVWYKIRKSLVAVRGINDINDVPLVVNENTQGAIFEFITDHGDIATQVLTAYIGLSSKNLSAGVMKS